MDIFWQYIAVAVLLAFAVAYLVYRFLTRRKKPKCDACPLYKSIESSTHSENTKSVENTKSIDNTEGIENTDERANHKSSII